MLRYLGCLGVLFPWVLILGASGAEVLEVGAWERACLSA